MKVFAIIIDEVNVCINENHNPILCTTKEIANKYFKEWVDNAKEDYDIDFLMKEDKESWVKEESEDYFSFYENGNYCQNHFDIRIEELEIVEE